MKAAAFLLVVLAISFEVTWAKVFTRCGLVKELRRHGLPEKDIPDWVCLVEAESSRDTSKRGGPNMNGSYDNGLFQINDKYWCSNGVKGKDCHARCEDLRKDDITEAVQCAKLIKRRQGFNAWYGWKNKCKGKRLPDVTKC